MQVVKSVAKWALIVYVGIMAVGLIVGVPVALLQGNLNIPPGHYTIPVGLIAYVGWRIVRRVMAR